MLLTCRHCQTRNHRGGRCIGCEKSLGSIRVAIVVALQTAALLIALQALLAALTPLLARYPLIELVFGAVVSFEVARRSGGRGMAYQAIASGITLAGLLLTHLAVVLVAWGRWIDNAGDIADIATLIVLFDPITFSFIVMGFLGGIWIWFVPD